MNTLTKTAALLTCLSGTFLSSSGKAAAQTRDDSTWINSAIAAAIANHASEYDLPAGTYVLNNPIVIPPGTRNFALKGAGSTQTILTAPYQAMNQAIMVGYMVQTHNNWGLTNRTNYSLNSIKQGDSTVSLVSPSRIYAGHYYCIWDSHTEWANNANVTCVMNHAEIVNPTAVNANGTITLDQPASREYDQTAQLADVDAYLCKNITVSGFGFDASIPGSTNASNSLVAVSLTDGAQISDVTVTNYLTDALNMVNSRNITIDRASISNAIATGPGQGYGVMLSRCRFVTVTNLTANNMRHGIICHAGTTDVSAANCSCIGCSLDAHGMDERRLSFTNCSGDNTCQFGNQAWPEGDRDITLNQCNFAGGFNACAYANNIQATSSTFGPLVLWSDLAGVTTPAPNQYPDRLSFTGCTFVGPNNLIAEATQMGTANFTNCAFNATRTSWGNVFQFKTMSGTLNFSGCSFSCASARNSDIALEFSSPNGLNLSLTNCSVTSAAAVPYAMELYSTYYGQASLKGTNTFHSTASKTSFLLNLSSVSTN